MEKRRTTASYVDKKDAKVIREPRTILVELELDKMHDKYGRVTPEQLLKDAQNKNHTLHQFFEWDDTEAAKKYRLHQAASMIMATKYIYVLKENSRRVPKLVTATPSPIVPVRKFIRAKDGGYRRRDLALVDAEERELFIETKKSKLVGWCREVIDIEELTPLRESIEELLKAQAEKVA